jgi:hypothetical protein
VPDVDDASRVHPIPEVIPHRPPSYGVTLVAALFIAAVAGTIALTIAGLIIYYGTRAGREPPPSPPTSIF